MVEANSPRRTRFCYRCVLCRRAKTQPHMAATLFPLHVPPIPWHRVGLDYLTHLPESNGFSNVLIVVDHLTRMPHFMPCTKTVIAEETTTFFLKGVDRLDGLPRVLVSDRDPKFGSGFWQTLWRRLGTRLNMSSSRHPEIDGLTERVNNTFQQVLRCFCCYDGSDWTALLPHVEFAYNASRALGVEHTPFEANFGFSPEEPPYLSFRMRPSIPFHKTRKSASDCYRKYIHRYALCHSYTKMRCKHAQHRLQRHTSSEETRCHLLQQTSFYVKNQTGK
jgi:hypothetical protein